MLFFVIVLVEAIKIGFFFQLLSISQF